MKLPSLQQIADESIQTLRRFPFVLAIAAAGTVAAIVLVENEAAAEPAETLRVLFAALLGGPLLIGLVLIAEKRRWGSVVRMILQSAGIILIAVYGWSLPEHIANAPELHAIRLLMLAVGLHLFVAVAPWLGRGEINGFWQFNKTLFLRMVTSLIFTMVLFAGLAIALAAVENLFEIPVPGERYGQLWIVLIGMFNTWFFLAGIPDALDSLDEITDYPKVLKIFTQFVLLPLVAVYLVILISYSGKIVIAWSWPYGWVSRLILGFSAAGMFSLLLLHPVRDREGNQWMRTVSRWFYIVLAPLLVLYFLAVMQRLSDYGITEGRYVAIVTGAWLSAMVIYFLFSRGQNIKAIPLTLCTLAFLSAVGPWSAFSISEGSQVNRLRSLLEKNGMLRSGKIHRATGDVPYADAKEISATLAYLHDVHGYEMIQPWFDISLRQESPGTRSEWKEPDSLAMALAIEFVAVQRTPSDGSLAFDASRTEALVVTGYDRVLPERYFNQRNPDRSVTLNDVSYSLNASLDTLTVNVRRGSPDDGGNETADSTVEAEAVPDTETMRLPLQPVVDSLLSRYHGEGARDVPPESMAAEVVGNRIRVKVYCLRLSVERGDDGRKITNIGLRVLYGRNHLSK